LRPIRAVRSTKVKVITAVPTDGLSGELVSPGADDVAMKIAGHEIKGAVVPRRRRALIVMVLILVCRLACVPGGRRERPAHCTDRHCRPQGLPPDRHCRGAGRRRCAPAPRVFAGSLESR
jgi:hypothetical protein